MTLRQIYKGLFRTLDKYKKDLEKEELIMYPYVLEKLQEGEYKLFHLGEFSKYFDAVKDTYGTRLPSEPHLPFPRCMIHIDTPEDPAGPYDLIIAEEVMVDGIMHWHAMPVLIAPWDKEALILSRIAFGVLPKLDETQAILPEHVFAVGTANQGLEDSEEIRDLSMLYTSIMLGLVNILSCKNIEIVEKTHENKIKKNRPPRKDLCYHEIVVKVPGKGYHYQGQTLKEIPFREMAKHEAGFQKRGHFKTFTEDAPLFGKHVGTWWWSPIFGASKNTEYRIRVSK